MWGRSHGPCLGAGNITNSPSRVNAIRNTLSLRPRKSFVSEERPSEPAKSPQLEGFRPTSRFTSSPPPLHLPCIVVFFCMRQTSRRRWLLAAVRRPNDQPFCTSWRGKPRAPRTFRKPFSILSGVKDYRLSPPAVRSEAPIPQRKRVSAKTLETCRGGESLDKFPRNNPRHS